MKKELFDQAENLTKKIERIEIELGYINRINLNRDAVITLINTSANHYSSPPPINIPKSIKIKIINDIKIEYEKQLKSLKEEFKKL